jgi:predicted dehydrogenase
VQVAAQIPRFFWNFPAVEDNSFLLFKTAVGQVAQIHVSWTQWVNIFLFEIFGRDGYLRLTGRDGHYGPQKLVWGRRQLNHGRPDEQSFDFEPPDDSWVREWSEFCDAIKTGCKPQGSAEDGLRALQLIEGAYRSARNNEWIDVTQVVQTIGSQS